MKIKQKNIIIPIIIGVLLGYLILHPASLLIVNIFEKQSFDVGRILLESFAMVHIAMSIFFIFLGGFIGFIFSLYYNLDNRFYSELTDINIQLSRYNRDLLGKLGSESEDLTIFVKQLWPTLIKIQQGVDLVLEDESKKTKAYKSNVLSITKENISSLFELIDTMVLPEKKKGN